MSPQAGADWTRLHKVGVLTRGVPLLRRIRAGLNRAGNWWQLIRFCLVGGSCYVVNVGTFAVAVELLGVHYLIGSVLAYAVAITYGFFAHRVITFRARQDKARAQAPRFVAIYLPATVLGTGLLHLGVVAGLPEVTAQAVSGAVLAPLTFAANKMWSFGRPGNVRGALVRDATASEGSGRSL